MGRSGVGTPSKSVGRPVAIKGHLFSSEAQSYCCRIWKGTKTCEANEQERGVTTTVVSGTRSPTWESPCGFKITSDDTEYFLYVKVFQWQKGTSKKQGSLATHVIPLEEILNKPGEEVEMKLKLKISKKKLSKEVGAGVLSIVLAFSPQSKRRKSTHRSYSSKTTSSSRVKRKKSRSRHHSGKDVVDSGGVKHRDGDADEYLDDDSEVDLAAIKKFKSDTDIPASASPKKRKKISKGSRECEEEGERGRERGKEKKGDRVRGKSHGSRTSAAQKIPQQDGYVVNSYSHSQNGMKSNTLPRSSPSKLPEEKVKLVGGSENEKKYNTENITRKREHMNKTRSQYEFEYMAQLADELAGIASAEDVASLPDTPDTALLLAKRKQRFEQRENDMAAKQRLKFDDEEDNYSDDNVDTSGPNSWYSPPSSPYSPATSPHRSARSSVRKNLRKHPTTGKEHPSVRSVSPRKMSSNRPVRGRGIFSDEKNVLGGLGEIDEISEREFKERKGKKRRTPNRTQSAQPQRVRDKELLEKMDMISERSGNIDKNQSSEEEEIFSSRSKPKRSKTATPRQEKDGTGMKKGREESKRDKDEGDREMGTNREGKRSSSSGSTGKKSDKELIDREVGWIEGDVVKGERKDAKRREGKMSRSPNPSTSTIESTQNSTSGQLSASPRSPIPHLSPSKNSHTHRSHSRRSRRKRSKTPRSNHTVSKTSPVGGKKKKEKGRVKEEGEGDARGRELESNNLIPIDFSFVDNLNTSELSDFFHTPPVSVQRMIDDANEKESVDGEDDEGKISREEKEKEVVEEESGGNGEVAKGKNEDVTLLDESGDGAANKEQKKEEICIVKVNGEVLVENGVEAGDVVNKKNAQGMDKDLNSSGNMETKEDIGGDCHVKEKVSDSSDAVGNSNNSRMDQNKSSHSFMTTSSPPKSKSDSSILLSFSSPGLSTATSRRVQNEDYIYSFENRKEVQKEWDSVLGDVDKIFSLSSKKSGLKRLLSPHRQPRRAKSSPRLGSGVGYVERGRVWDDDTSSESILKESKVNSTSTSSMKKKVVDGKERVSAATNPTNSTIKENSKKELGKNGWSNGEKRVKNKENEERTVPKRDSWKIGGKMILGGGEERGRRVKSLNHHRAKSASPKRRGPRKRKSHRSFFSRKSGDNFSFKNSSPSTPTHSQRNSGRSYNHVHSLPLMRSSNSPCYRSSIILRSPTTTDAATDPIISPLASSLSSPQILYNPLSLDSSPLSSSLTSSAIGQSPSHPYSHLTTSFPLVASVYDSHNVGTPVSGTPSLSSSNHGASSTATTGTRHASPPLSPNMSPVRDIVMPWLGVRVGSRGNVAGMGGGAGGMSSPREKIGWEREGTKTPPSLDLNLFEEKTSLDSTTDSNKNIANASEKNENVELTEGNDGNSERENVIEKQIGKYSEYETDIKSSKEENREPNVYISGIPIQSSSAPSSPSSSPLVTPTRGEKYSEERVKDLLHSLLSIPISAFTSILTSPRGKLSSTNSAIKEKLVNATDLYNFTAPLKTVPLHSLITTTSSPLSRFSSPFTLSRTFEHTPGLLSLAQWYRLFVYGLLQSIKDALGNGERNEVDDDDEVFRGKLGTFAGLLCEFVLLVDEIQWRISQKDNVSGEENILQLYENESSGGSNDGVTGKVSSETPSSARPEVETRDSPEDLSVPRNDPWKDTLSLLTHEAAVLVVKWSVGANASNVQQTFEKQLDFISGRVYNWISMLE